MTEPSHLLQLQELKTYFFTFEGTAKAVDDVSFFLDKGEVLGIVGESGCGKSVTAQSVMRLIPDPPGKIVHGKILFDGTDIVKLPMERMRSIRGNRISMIFQEPMTSLNPVYTIGDQIAEMFILHEKRSKPEGWERAVAMLKKVQIPAPEKRAHEYPHQLSGGMRQRAMIAMALACNPEILIADEPTTALDVTIQAQILDLMRQLREDYHTAIMMITHDLGVIAEMAQRIVVMYAGKVVEEAPTLGVFEDSKHPYTQGLLKSIPKLGERSRHGRQRLKEIAGIVPSLYELPPGCSFYPRCPHVMPQCKDHPPVLTDAGGGHRVRCWLYPSGSTQG
ncbi:MAG: ABC transporter ATP-binding protein [Desulfobacterales bacterium]|nr:MAG: ABC transporter ATP-binding protein [Desulfobacterales bacterium]